MFYRMKQKTADYKRYQEEIRTIITFTDGDDFIPNVYDFDNALGGISDASGITDDSTIPDFFKLFVDAVVIDWVLML